MSPFSFSSSFRNRSIETGGIAYSSSDEVRAHLPDVPPLAGPGQRRRSWVRGLELAPAMGDRCCLVHGGAGRREGGVVVIAVRLALCALVWLGVGCQGPARDRATQRAPTIRVVAPADTVPRSLNIYAAAGAGMLSPAARRAKPLVYVPNSKDGTVSVVDPRTYRVVRTFATGALPQHVVPAYDLATLWVANNLGNSLTPIDPVPGPDGRVFYVADMMANGVFLVDPAAFRRVGFIATGKGAHGIYPSRDGRLLYVSNRGWNTVGGRRRGPGSVTVLDPATQAIVATWPVPGGGSPDMGNVTADGTELWLSGRYDEEVYVFDTATGRLTHRIGVGREPHGLCVWPQPGRDSLGHPGNLP